MTTKNQNCLEGLACPQCRNEDYLKIAGVGIADVTDDGADITGDIEWNDRSFTRCPQCDYTGILRNFQTPSHAPAITQHPDAPLPSDPDEMNDRRSAWAAAAIDAFREATRTDEDDALCDLLTDLMHWADRSGHDFEVAYGRAIDHFQAETAPDSLVPFDTYEINPCRRFEEPGSPGRFYFEVCEPHEADVWTLYGRIPGEGVEAIGDFSTREGAEQILARITGRAYSGVHQPTRRSPACRRRE